MCFAHETRCCPLTGNVGLSWRLIRNLPWLVGLFTKEEATDFTEPTPRGSQNLPGPPGLEIKVLLDFPTLTQFPTILICVLVILVF